MSLLSRFAFAGLLVVLTAPSSLVAQEPIRFARTPDISPDGKIVAFSYLGDIWTVETIGGVARPVTMHEAHDINPCISRDGRSIAFSSNRHGSYDVYVVPIHGGRPRRLTFDSAQDMALGWTADGKSVVFQSTRGTDFPNSPAIYTVPADGGREIKLPFQEAKELAFAPSGNRVAFARGPGTWYRKGYRGSSNDELWLANSDGSAVSRLTDFNGQDGSPMWGPDARKLYYVSEQFGSAANVVVQDLTSAGLPDGKPRPVTTHAEDAVRRARISGNGDWIVYECGGDIWLASSRDGQTRKLAIEVHADEKTNTEKLTTFTKNVTEFALSPDDKHLAFVVHGEIFLMPVSGGKAQRLTDTPSVEHGVSWATDGKSILFATDRNGQEDLYLLEPDDPEHPELTKAHRFKTKQLTNTPEAETAASFSPDGSRIGFLRGGKFWTMKPNGSDAKVLVDQQMVADYDWSPDGKWVVYSKNDGSFASELFIIPVDGSAAARNVTRYATYNGNVSWNNSGGKICFLSQRRSIYAMHVLSLQKPAAPLTPSSSSPPESAIDWDDIHLRAERPGGNVASEGIISANGRWIAYRAGSGTDDLWLVSADGTVMQKLSTGGIAPSYIQWTRNSQSIWFLDAEGNLRTSGLGMGGIPTTAGAPPPPNTLAFSAKMIIRQSEEFLQMFDQSWNALANTYYDAKHHGVDWKAVREKYRPLVAHVAMKEDLYSLISLMLGELNSSHLGIFGPSRAPDEITGDLGLIFDESHKGPGLKISEVIKRGPADKRNLNLKPGDVIFAIDRNEVTDKTNVSQLLNAKLGEMVLLEVGSNPNDPKTRRKLEIQPAPRAVIANLMYQRWVEKNAAMVANQSQGSLGYIHIPSMNEAGLEQFVRSLYSDNFDKDAIVIDVRYNGGGFTHDQVLNYLGAREHTLFRQRDGGEGLVMRHYDRKWTKPAIVVVNNRSFSDAEIFPSAFRSLGLGKVVGEATGGNVILTNSVKLIDGSTFSTPRTGVYNLKGRNMEKEGVLPDVAVDALPEDLARGKDAQLGKAVEVLLQDVAAWKKAKNPAATSAPMERERLPMPMPVATTMPK